MSLTLLEAAQAKLEGKRVEVLIGANYFDWDGESWSEHWVFRIAPPPKKKVKFLCVVQSGYLEFIQDGKAMSPDWRRIPELDKEVGIEQP